MAQLNIFIYIINPIIAKWNFKQYITKWIMFLYPFICVFFYEWGKKYNNNKRHKENLTHAAEEKCYIPCLPLCRGSACKVDVSNDDVISPDERFHIQAFPYWVLSKRLVLLMWTITRPPGSCINSLHYINFKEIFRRWIIMQFIAI